MNFTPKHLGDGKYFSASVFSTTSRYGTHKNFETLKEATQWVESQKKRLKDRFSNGRVLATPEGQINMKQVFSLEM